MGRMRSAPRTTPLLTSTCAIRPACLLACPWPPAHSRACANASVCLCPPSQASGKAAAARAAGPPPRGKGRTDRDRGVGAPAAGALWQIALLRACTYSKHLGHAGSYEGGTAASARVQR